MNQVLVTSEPTAPPGLHIRRKGASDRYFVTDDTSQRILMSVAGTDLIEGVLKTGHSFMVHPPSKLYRWTEVYFIIQGELEFQMGPVTKLLGAHSHVISDHLHKEAKLTAKTDVKYVYFKTPKIEGQIGRETQTVESKDGSFRLLFSRSGKELVVGTVSQNHYIFFEPFQEDFFGAQEAYYMLEGTLSHVSDNGGFDLHEGDCVITDCLEDVIRFKAQEATAYLYFSGVPIFTDIHKFHHDLIELAIQVEKKDGYTAEHCSRIRTLSLKTGIYLGLSDDALLNLSYGAYLHDIGKLKVPLEILQKPGKLNDEEWEVVKRHPSYGLDILRSSSFEGAGVIVSQHHERMDGSGYPNGLKNKEILTESYIVAVADAFDAMTTDRPYRKALSTDYAFGEILKFADIHYPSEIVEAFITANFGEKRP